MSQSKEKKVILVTGASSGMGKNFAQALLKEGHVVYGAARRVENMKELTTAGGCAVKMDITDENQIDAAIEKIINEQGKIDVLINNAGYAVYGSVEETSLEDARKQFDVNLFGLAYLTQKVIPHMRNKKYGSIVNVSSMGGKMYTVLGAWYHASKYALEGWSDCLRVELKHFGINVVVIEPGVVETEFSDVLNQSFAERSGNGPYRKFVESIARSEKTMKLSKPDVITKLILKAIKAKNPKTRYVGGSMAKPMIFIRKWFGDRVFDSILLSMVK